ncbi:MAG: hypothetical protein H6Q57_994 [Geobacteraceae bacterium]|nr:hypothetical protein [Geobacteraceae bacterium]
MHVFSIQFHLHLPSQSLKGKRGIVKSILARARNSFNVSAAEVGLHDVHGSTRLAFVTVSEDPVKARRVLEQLEEWLVEERPDIDIVDVYIEAR